MNISNVYRPYDVQKAAQIDNLRNTQTPSARMSRTEEQKDMVQLSTQAKDFYAAKKAMAAVPDIRMEMISPIKAQLEAGTYQVPAEAVAEKMLGMFS